MRAPSTIPGERDFFMDCHLYPHEYKLFVLKASIRRTRKHLKWVTGPVWLIKEANEVRITRRDEQYHTEVAHQLV